MLKSITFEVVGNQQLSCEGCEQRVVRLLKTLQGVRQVRAQARTQQIEVLLDTAVLEINAITERLSQAGYHTKVSSLTSGSGH